MYVKATDSLHRLHLGVGHDNVGRIQTMLEQVPVPVSSPADLLEKVKRGDFGQ